MVPSNNVVEHLQKFEFQKQRIISSSENVNRHEKGEDRIQKRFHEVSQTEVEGKEEVKDISNNKKMNDVKKSDVTIKNGNKSSESHYERSTKSDKKLKYNLDINKEARSTCQSELSHSNSASDKATDKKNPETKVQTNGVLNHAQCDTSDSDSYTANNAKDHKEQEKVVPKKYSRIRSFVNSKHGSKGDTSDSSSDEEIIRSSKSVKRKVKSLPSKTAKKVKVSSDNEYWSDKVYDSSDNESDYEISDEMSETQKRVFDFLNEASSIELLQIQTCTEKKVNAIIEGRPYKGWKDLVYKFSNGKLTRTQLLNYTLDTIKTRSIVSKLMKKCLDLAISTEKAISAGSSILDEQPSVLSKSLKLMPYQLIGLNWLAIMHSQQLNGILADEMGLGKTIQVIAFFGYLKENGLSSRPHLVVAPTTTLDNWAIECTKWCPDLRLAIYHGTPDERRELRLRWFKGKFSTMDVIITTYNLVANSPEEKKMFKIMPLEYVIFDEAHMLKNMNTQRYFNLFNINAQHRILLTGTPLQNNLLELMSLLNFVMPGMFAANIKYIKAFFSKNSKLPVNKLPDFEKEQIELAKRIMKPFFLRRLKGDVLTSLPKKTNTEIYCPMEAEQKEKYDQLLAEIKDNSQSQTGEYNYMASFMQLRKLANHPLSLCYHYKESDLVEIADRLSYDYNYKQTNKDYILEDLQCMSDHEIHQLTRQYKCIAKFKLSDSLFFTSGKFKKLDELLPKLKEEGHRVVMFSQFVFILDIIEDYMRLRGHNFLRLDGSTKSLDRQELIDNYNEDSDIFVFLLSTKAGGVGINLTSADTVIIHDVDFNPYNDKQAEDRCHRLGQKRPVKIIRLISEGTVEESIYAKAKSKLELEQEIIGNDEESADVELLLKEALGIRK